MNLYIKIKITHDLYVNIISIKNNFFTYKYNFFNLKYDLFYLKNNILQHMYYFV